MLFWLNIKLVSLTKEINMLEVLSLFKGYCPFGKAWTLKYRGGEWSFKKYSSELQNYSQILQVLLSQILFVRSSQSLHIFHKAKKVLSLQKRFILAILQVFKLPLDCAETLQFY